MAIPTWSNLLLSLLKQVQDQDEHKMLSIKEALADEFALTPEERDLRLPRGTKIFYNRVDWARESLKEAKLIESPRKAYIKVTEKGLELLRRTPAITKEDIIQIIKAEKERLLIESEETTSNIREETIIYEDMTPLESIEKAYEEIKKEVKDNLLEYIRSHSSDSDFFEMFVLDFLFRMGYGVEGIKLGRSHDGGIDGKIFRDKMGLNQIYIQAKNIGNSIGAPKVNEFIGTFIDKPHLTGIFIITSTFTYEAREIEKSKEGRLKLIDGSQLIELMYQNDIGLKTSKKYEIKELDEEYFSDLIS